ncbi:MAG: 3-hydroxyacyl-ACP dehydratase FabZ family protein [Oscillospiraceae bacterium]
MNQNEIMKILPHRDNMLLLDEVEKAEDLACGKYHVRGDEWFLKGHFPGNPVVPGVILCEILAQSACILLTDKMSGKVTPMYTGLNNVRFKSPVRPGDTFVTACKITRAKPPFYYGEGEGTVNGKLCVKAEFSFAVLGE